MPLLNAMKVREVEAIRASTHINLLQGEMLKLRQQTSQAALLTKNVQQINKHTNKIDSQFELANHQLANINDVIDYKIVCIANDQEIIKKEQ